MYTLKEINLNESKVSDSPLKIIPETPAQATYNLDCTMVTNRTGIQTSIKLPK